ncbi:hypothetical protein D3C83_10220 [compost metagenome]
MLERSGRHDVGVAGEADERPAVAATRPQVIHAVRAQALAAKAERLEPRCDEIETAGVLRRDRAPRDQLAGEVEGG